MIYEIPDWYENGNNPWYISGKYLEIGQGNNSFSIHKKNDRDKLWITPLRLGSIDDLKVGKEIVFQDYDNGEWVECVGLETAILCLDYDFPIYIFDNHNHVFYAWCEARINSKHKSQNPKKPFWIWSDDLVLVHLDEHYDYQEPDNYNVNIDDLADVWRYTNEVLKIATYIRPAMKLGLFKECINFVESREFGGRFPKSDECVINLDLDVFHSDMNHIAWSEKVDVIKKCLSRTRLMTISTSPYFMDQEEALFVLKKVLTELF